MIKTILSNLNYIKSIIHWVLWWTTACITILILIILSFIIPKKTFNIFIKAGCSVMIFSALLFPRVKGVPKKDIPFPAVYIANHVSFFDLFTAGAVLPGYPRGVELYSHFFTPIYGWFITRFDQISLQAGNIASLRKTLQKCSYLLQNKIRNIYIAPEGTRTNTGRIGVFKNGAFHISKINNVPIIPVVYKGLFEKNNKTNFLINYGAFDVIILPPVYPKNFKTTEALKNEVRSRMIKVLSEK